MTGTTYHLTDWDIRCMAYHEAGHATCSYFLPEREPLITITIDPSDESFGMIKTLPREHHNETEASLTGTIATFLAGRIAEEKFCGIKSTSCIYDLVTARDIARDMVGKFGMGRRMKLLAGISFADNSFEGYSEQTRRMIDADIMEIVDKSAQIAEDLLQQHQGCVHDLAAVLIERKTLSGELLKDFFEAHKRE